MELQKALSEKILVMDGGMGTALFALDLAEKDYGGSQFEGCHEYLNIINPSIVEQIHTSFLEAGSDIIETNTFAGSPITLAEFNLQDQAHEINLTAARVARKAADKFPGTFVLGAMGPTNKTVSVTKSITYDELYETYYIQAKALLEGGVDGFIVETCFDTLNAKAACAAIKKAQEEKSIDLPLLISVTIESSGTMLGGQDIESAYESLKHFKPLAFGLNCATGPDLMTDHVRTLSEIADTNTLCYPNAGIPDEDGVFPDGPESFAKQMQMFINKGWINLIGGCCGTTPEHIKALKQIAGKPRRIPQVSRSISTGIETVNLDDVKPALVGERTNSIGSRKFKRLIANEQYEEAAEIGVAQVKKGANIVDICLANPDRDEIEDTIKFYDIIAQKVRVPFMIDSTDPAAIEQACKRMQGKGIINSVNFEDGVERFDEVLELVKQYGLSVIVGTIDEDKIQAMALTADRKFEVASRAIEYLKEKWDLPEEDIIIDPLVFPLGTGEDTYKNSAIETIEAIKKIKETYPRVNTILGVSNVSFGLPTQGREALNSVYVYHTTKAGLDLAIVNTQRIERYGSLSEKEKELCENLLLNRTDNALEEFVAFYRKQTVREEVTEDLPLNERLRRYIVEGIKTGLTEDLDIALQDSTPLEIINGPLMEGMAIVGELFNDNQLIVSEVLQSAESMKAAVSFLEPHMEQKEDALRGKVILATVKGDVHDIGKNLIGILLSNNCYKVIDLGIKVTPEALIEAIREHNPDVVGLSGLLVKSAHMMVSTLEDFSQAGIRTPVFVGGAALTKRFTDTKIAPIYQGMVCYCREAMDGLAAIDSFLEDPETFKNKIQNEQKNLSEVSATKKSTPVEEFSGRSFSEVPPLQAPDYDVHIEEDWDVKELWNMINPVMLYSVHLGLKGNYYSLLEKKDPKLMKLIEQVNEAKKVILEKNLFHPKAIYRFCKARREKDTVILPDLDVTLTYERQKVGKRLCAADLVSDKEDSIAMFVTTCGGEVIEYCQDLREKGEYVASHVTQILALETAEALAEVLHTRLRKKWGINDGELTNKELFAAKYQGIRLSHGYPACPDLSEQKKVWKVLEPEHIGVGLTEGFMMDPEASVSAVVFHHPEGRYFAI